MGKWKEKSRTEKYFFEMYGTTIDSKWNQQIFEYREIPSVSQIYSMGYFSNNPYFVNIHSMKDEGNEQWSIW